MLDDDTLDVALVNMLLGVDPTYPPTAAQAGTNWASIYRNYGVDGEASAVPPTEAGDAQDVLEAALGAAFELQGDPDEVAAEIAAALQTYWQDKVTFAGATGPPVSTGTAALVVDLTAIFAFIGGTVDSKAQDIADAFGAFTRLVQVTFPGPTVVFVV